jgi:2-amino-4-hydroxy-6-hydroxymethyldihydropteridine diphosphokinase
MTDGKPCSPTAGQGRKGPQANRAVIAFGSNIDPELRIGQARARIGGFLTILAVSDFVTTRPVGNPDQPDYRNGVVLAETMMNKEELEAMLHTVETELGRVRTAGRYGPRTIDLDIIWWNGQICHPDVGEREYLRNALREVLEK